VEIAYLERDRNEALQVRDWLGQAGHECTHCSRGEELDLLLSQRCVDALLIGWRAAEMSAHQLMERIRSRGNGAPVVVIGERGDEETAVGAFSAGADDYVFRPVGRSELLARLESVARRTGDAAAWLRRSFKIGPWHVDGARRSIYLDGRPAPLTQKDFELACYFFRNPGKLMTRSHLLREIWGIDKPIKSRTVDVHVSRIRRSLEIRPHRGYQIRTVYQHGYRLEASGRY
jgi:two-component system response regulator RegX3